MGWPETQPFAPLAPVEVSCVTNTNHLCLVKGKRGTVGRWTSLTSPGPARYVAVARLNGRGLTQDAPEPCRDKGPEVPVRALGINPSRLRIHKVK